MSIASITSCYFASLADERAGHVMQDTFSQSSRTSVPVRLPHYARRHAHLYFLCSRRPAARLDAQEVRVWEHIDGKRCIAEFDRLGAGAVGTIERFAREGWICLQPPPVDTPATAPHLLVVEPHMDDAALSVGGALLKRRGRSRITILSVVRQSNYTSYIRQRRDYLDIDTITSLRLEESRLAAALLGAEFRCLDWLDAPNRFLPAEHWTVGALPQIGRAVEAFVHAPIYPDQVERLAVELARAVNELGPQELWLPMALGDHADHRLVHQAGLLMLSRRPAQAPPLAVQFYEDLPYASVENAQAATARLHKLGWTVSPVLEPIDEVYDAKLAALGVYASQFKLSVMTKRLQTTVVHAGAPQSPARCERRHALIQAAPPMPSGSTPMADCVVRDWARRHAQTPMLTLIMLPSGHFGQWSEDLDAIRRAFPRARLRLLLTVDVAWEWMGQATADDGTDVVHLPRSASSLARALISEVLRHPHVPRVWVHWSANDSVHGMKASIQRWLLGAGPSLQVRVLAEFTSRLDIAPTCE